MSLTQSITISLQTEIYQCCLHYPLHVSPSPFFCHLLILGPVAFSHCGSLKIFLFIDLQFNIQDAQISILASATGVYISWQSTYVVKVEGSAQNPISRHLSRPCRQFWGPLLVIFDVAGIEQVPASLLGWYICICS